MQETAFNYRDQLVTIFWCLDQTAIDLFHTAFEIGLEEEWQDLRDSLKDDDNLIIRPEYLETIQHKAVPRLLDMAHIIFETRDKLENINHLSDDDIYLSDDEEEIVENLTEDNQEDSGDTSTAPKIYYLEMWQEVLQEDFFKVYEGVLTLALGEEPSMEVLDLFWFSLYDGDLKLESNDYNVNFLLEGLNRVLKVFGATAF